MSRNLVRMVAAMLALALVATACGGDDSKASDDGGNGGSTEKIDYAKIGLWDDGPCDTAKPKLVIGQATVFQSPALSLEDQAKALEASAEAFNKRGGANGSCIEVHVCDDGGTVDKARACVKTLDDAKIVATVNDQGTAGQADVRKAMEKAAIPRVATNVVPEDWDSKIMFPLDASGTGVTFLLPQAIIDKGEKKIGIARVDLAAASAIVSFLEGLYKPQGASFPYAVPVPQGTTDYSQFILGAQNAGVGGLDLTVGEQDAVQIVKAGQQLNSDLVIGASLGSFPHDVVADLGDYAENLAFLWSFMPPTFDLPVYDALRADLAASNEEALQPGNLKASPMRSWIGLYALLKIIRDAKLTDFSRASITQALRAAKDVPMLGMFGDASWTPDFERKGLWSRAGIDAWVSWKWDPKAESVAGDGNWVKVSDVSFDKVTCGTVVGAPGPC